MTRHATSAAPQAAKPPFVSRTWNFSGLMRSSSSSIEILDRNRDAKKMASLAYMSLSTVCCDLSPSKLEDCPRPLSAAAMTSIVCIVANKVAVSKAKSSG